MLNSTACIQENFIEKLRELNFNGPMTMAGHQFMLYYGQLLVIPSDEEFSVAQFRFLLKQVEGIVSQEEWQF